MRLFRYLLLVVLSLMIHQTLHAQFQDVAWIQWPSLAVYRVSFSPDSRYVAAESNDYAVRIWDVVTGNLLQTLIDSSSSQGYSWPIRFSADGKSLVRGTYDAIKFLAIPSGAVMQTVSTPAGGAHAISPDLRLFANSWVYAITLFNMPAGDSARTIQLGQNYTNVLTFSPDGSMIAAGYQTGRIQLFSTATGDSLLSLQAHTITGYGNVIAAISFSPDGRYMASGGADRIIKVWDVATGQLVRRMFGHTDWVNAVDFSSDGKFLVSGASDGTVRVWDVATGNNVYTYNEYPGNQSTVAFSPDMRYIASGTQDGAMIVWNAKYIRTSDVDDQISANDEIRIDQNQPNPVTSSTSIGFSIREPRHVTLEVFNAYGRRVAMLADSEMEAGAHVAAWDASTHPAGIYYCRLTAGASSVMRRVTVMR